MDAASGDAVPIFPGINIDFDLDGFDFDFDLAADEFCVAGGDDGDYFVAAADKKSALPALDLGSPERDGGSGREGSPDSVVTDGPLASGDGSMSEYVSELERFLMEDDGERTVEDLAADEYFNDLLADREDVFPVTDAGGNAEDDEEGLAAHEDEATSRKRARYE